MFNDIPVQFWLLLFFAIIAWPPAKYVFDHVRSDPAKRDITRPQQDLSWRTTRRLLRSMLILTALAAAAVFIYTPQAEQMAKAPEALPILVAACSLWALFSVGRGLIDGRIRPFVQGLNDEYDRQTQPKRFWASITWNGLFGGGMLWVSFLIAGEAAEERAGERCFSKDPRTPSDVRKDACVTMLGVYDAQIRKDPSDSAAHYDRALPSQMLRNPQAAIAGYATAIRLRPDDPDAYFNRGLIHLDAMDYDLALADFDRAHRLEPNDADALANRGMVYAWKGFTDSATSDFARARAIDKDNVVAMRGEVLLAINLTEFDLAVERATQTLARHSDDPWTLIMRAAAYRRLVELEKAASDELRANLLTSGAYP